jgi:hypothetical protein
MRLAKCTRDGRKLPAWITLKKSKRNLNQGESRSTALPDQEGQSEAKTRLRLNFRKRRRLTQAPLWKHSIGFVSMASPSLHASPPLVHYSIAGTGSPNNSNPLRSIARNVSGRYGLPSPTGVRDERKATGLGDARCQAGLSCFRGQLYSARILLISFFENVAPESGGKP